MRIRYSKTTPKVAYYGEILNHTIYWSDEVPKNLKEFLEEFEKRKDISLEIMHADRMSVNKWYVNMGLNSKGRRREPIKNIIMDFFEIGKFYKCDNPLGDVLLGRCEPYYYKFEPTLDLEHIHGHKCESLVLKYTGNDFQKHKDIEKLKKELSGKNKTFIQRFIQITEEEVKEILNTAKKDGFLEEVLKD